MKGEGVDRLRPERSEEEIDQEIQRLNPDIARWRGYERRLNEIAIRLDEIDDLETRGNANSYELELQELYHERRQLEAKSGALLADNRDLQIYVDSYRSRESK